MLAFINSENFVEYNYSFNAPFNLTTIEISCPLFSVLIERNNFALAHLI